MASQVIVLGGGLAGLSAAHTVLEHGGRVVVLDKARALSASWVGARLTAAHCPLGLGASVLRGAAHSAGGRVFCARAARPWARRWSKLPW